MGSPGDGLRLAGPADAAAIAALVNPAYEVERFFVAGDRTSAATVGQLMETSAFIVADDEQGDLTGSIHVDVAGERASFGMLAVRTAAQGRGLGQRLIVAAESYARERGAIVMEIRVVNLRTELFPFYARLGYEVVRTAPYDHRPVVQPCHFQVMEKRLL